ncbi:MAG: hypothetical protein IIZ34_04515, partial [Eubacterium sp.]|nr:hypothetical protein [Eubacterium sp.]
QRHDINAVYYPAGSRFPYDYTILMRDKFLFETFMRATFGDRNCYCASEGVMIGKNLFVWDLGKSLEKITVEELLRRFDGEKIVCKMSFGFSGAGVRVAEVSGNCITEEGKTYEAEEFFSMLSASNAVWLIQKFIRQHEALKQLNETSVNTMRIVTFHTGEEICVSKTVLRCGQKGALIDNVGSGGKLVGTDDEGRLARYMFCSQEGRKEPCPYAGQQIPFYAEAKELAKRAHSFLPGLFTVGWDVAFCPNGPIIVEGNDGWDPNMMQISHGPLRETWDTMLQLRKSHTEVLLGRE